MENSAVMPKMFKTSAMKPYKKRVRKVRVNPRERRQREQYYRKNKTKLKKAAERWRQRHKTRVQKYS